MRGLGNGLCLPAGPLREPATRLQEVDAIVVNGGDWGHAGVFRGEIAPTRVVQVVSGKSRQLGDFKGASVHAVAGIGNPQRFFDMLEQWELDVDSKPLADHADISKEILSFSGPEPVMITEKDAVKCRAIAHDKLWCVVAELQFHEQDDERLMRLIMRQLGLRAQAQ